MQTPFDETLFEAVDEEGRAYTCRALLCFEREEKFFILYIEEGAEPIPQNLRAGYVYSDQLVEGATVSLLPLESQQQWEWIHEHLRTEIENFLRDMFLTAQDEETSLFLDNGEDLDFAHIVESYISSAEDFDEERDLYAPDADGNYLS